MAKGNYGAARDNYKKALTLLGKPDTPQEKEIYISLSSNLALALHKI